MPWAVVRGSFLLVFLVHAFSSGCCQANPAIQSEGCSRIIEDPSYIRLWQSSSKKILMSSSEMGFRLFVSLQKLLAELYHKHVCLSGVSYYPCTLSDSQSSLDPQNIIHSFYKRHCTQAFRLCLAHSGLGRSHIDNNAPGVV